MDTDIRTLIMINIELVKSIDKMIDEKIRSDKVIEGVLKDISNGIDRIADRLEDARLS